MDDLINEFIAETAESLSVLDGELITLERHPENKAILSSIYHIVHTIKSTSRFLGLPRLEAVAHGLEMIVGKIRDSEVCASAEVVSLILESLDRVKGLVDYLAEHEEELSGDDDALVQRLNQFVENAEVSVDITAPVNAAETAAPAPALSYGFLNFGDDDDDEPEEKWEIESEYETEPALEVVTPEALIAEDELSVLLKAEEEAIAGFEAAAHSPQIQEQPENQSGAISPVSPVSDEWLDDVTSIADQLTLTHNQLQNLARAKDDEDFTRPLQQLSQLTTGLHDALTIVRPEPQTILAALIVEANGQKLALPQANVMELVHVAPSSEIAMEDREGKLAIRLRGELLPLAVLSEILGHPVDRAELKRRDAYVALCRGPDYQFGMVVDRVCDLENILVTPATDILKNVSIYSGNAVLGDNSSVMIIDPASVASTMNIPEINKVAQSEVPEISEAFVVPEVQAREVASPPPPPVSEETTGFVVFSQGEFPAKAVSLELISRIEQISVTSIECLGDYPAVQYKDALIRLTTLDNEQPIPDTGMLDVLIFQSAKGAFGLVVDKVEDIAHAPASSIVIAHVPAKKAYLGSMTIGENTVDVVDVEYLLSQFGDQELHDIVRIDRAGLQSISRYMLSADEAFA